MRLMWQDKGQVLTEFVSSWESFTSSPKDELGFGNEQYLPFNQCLVAFPACAAFLLDPNSSEGFLKSIFPLADQPISTLAMKGVHFREAVPIPSDQKAKWGICQASLQAEFSLWSKSFTPWQREGLGNLQQLWHTPNSVRNGAPHPKTLPGIVVNC